ncbi:CidA/LrgA family protein [Bacillus thermotolerans]|uniref:Antiholin-like protein LrgA n=1 Tax=Bacillus thermotolerans TaxID=1221996 RepID=A0A0F5I0J3_BACTR|nr:CidA/LrgA family protein [Bacillus thermotolerans]KKB35430.1 Antiholin-like protein LrgA [Bacillus thermotolerans]KKB39016.1 Antiholin-like protein LrgA [Bacillus thermotolerans]KKB40869.1 Antiholin-like protein LrgA [Bacillus thermotolerans]
MVKQGGIFLAQIALLWLIYQAGVLISSFLHLPVPGSVLGMIILFLLLTAKVIRLDWIEKGAAFLNKHLAFFFIPISVGLMVYLDLLKESGITLAVILFGSSIIGMAVTGGTVQILSKRTAEGKKGESAHEQRHSV